MRRRRTTRHSIFSPFKTVVMLSPRRGPVSSATPRFDSSIPTPCRLGTLHPHSSFLAAAHPAVASCSWRLTAQQKSIGSQSREESLWGGTRCSTEGRETTILWRQGDHDVEAGRPRCGGRETTILWRQGDHAVEAGREAQSSCPLWPNIMFCVLETGANPSAPGSSLDYHDEPCFFRFTPNRGKDVIWLGIPYPEHYTVFFI